MTTGSTSSASTDRRWSTPAASGSLVTGSRWPATASGTSTRASSSFAGSATTSEAPSRRSAKRTFPNALRPASKPADEALGGQELAKAGVRRRGRRRHRLLSRMGRQLVRLHQRQPARSRLLLLLRRGADLHAARWLGGL